MSRSICDSVTRDMPNTDATLPAMDKANCVRPGLEKRPWGAQRPDLAEEPFQIEFEAGLTSILPC
jgi:hypothetical protein